jgi:hypothetical protein
MTEEAAHDDGMRWLTEGWDAPSDTTLTIYTITDAAAEMVARGSIALERGDLEIRNGVIEVRP